MHSFGANLQPCFDNCAYCFEWLIMILWYNEVADDAQGTEGQKMKEYGEGGDFIYGAGLVMAKYFILPFCYAPSLITAADEFYKHTHLHAHVYRIKHKVDYLVNCTTSTKWNSTWLYSIFSWYFLVMIMYYVLENNCPLLLWLIMHDYPRWVMQPLACRLQKITDRQGQRWAPAF